MCSIILKPRPFLVILVLPAMLLAGGQSKPSRKPAARKADAARKGDAAPKGDLEKIAAAYALEVVTTDPKFPVATKYGAIDGKSAAKPELEAYALLFAPEFSLYPPELVQRSQLKRIVLCSELSFAGQPRNAIPDYEHDTLYLDVRRGADNRPYMRRVIHHEFYHVIDFRDDGKVYADEDWAALNPQGMTYGRGGQAAQGFAETAVLTDRYPGFLNHYSTTAVEEDKAEMFANLIVNFEYVQARVSNDRVIQAKALRMKDLLSKFCPEMNDKFWEKIRKTKRYDQ